MTNSLKRMFTLILYISIIFNTEETFSGIYNLIYIIHWIFENFAEEIGDFIIICIIYTIQSLHLSFSLRSREDHADFSDESPILVKKFLLAVSFLPMRFACRRHALL